MISIIILALLAQYGCGFDERKKQLDQREQALIAREQLVMIKEKQLKLLEDSLKKNFEKIDSANLSQAEQTFPLPDSLAGSWNVNMVCTQTNCTGFAVGDIRKETWQIAGVDNNVTIRALQGEKLIRVYTGKFTGTQLKLATPETAQTATIMKVELNIDNQNKMNGQRIITQPDGCNTSFKADLDKLKTR
ncbi:hypothetical protein [Niabella ginsenosidivorans]|uniref:hypothetical protein n=1 Tax=Niabella ginsenosidivorans TaxID=1176587 RepID=UPI0012EDA75B|nr:hypothetical protein [Niabella ginsenosidivorans]